MSKREELDQVTGGVPPFGQNEESDQREFEEFSHWNPMPQKRSYRDRDER